MRKQLIIGFSILLITFLNVRAAEDCIPKISNPPKLVNDFADLLSDQAERQLESVLVGFNDTTSTQIAIVTVNDLCEYEPATFAFELGERWGVGNAQFNNGIVVLIKPKVSNSRGQAFIATGYGLESVLPDATTKRIVEKEMIPYFKKSDYQSGIYAAAKVIMEITGGEYSAKSYNGNRRAKKSVPVFPILFILFFVFIMLASTIGRARRYGRRNNMGLLAALWLMGSASNRHRGRYNDFTSGGGGFGGFGGGSGGFGGFGGGSFGGGGAGGSW